MRATRSARWLPAVFATLLAAGTLAGVGRSEEADLDSLRGRLVGARTPLAVDEALDALAERIGSSGGFEDARDFGDWLGQLPPEVAERSRVLLRRGWAYLAARRPADAAAPLHAVLEHGGEETGVALAYLGEAARLAGEPARAFERLTAACLEGYRTAFVVESAHKAAFVMRQEKPSKAFDDLPDYAVALDGILDVFDHPLLRTAAARWLLDDYAAYAIPGTKRARLWARVAARHALAAAPSIADLPSSGTEGTRLFFDAAVALEPEDRATAGRTLRFDLLSWAYRLGNRPDQDTHAIPPVVAMLAQAALDEGRYQLADRLARQRLGISDSPAARRVLDALPPDVGE